MFISAASRNKCSLPHLQTTMVGSWPDAKLLFNCSSDARKATWRRFSTSLVAMRSHKKRRIQEPNTLHDIFPQIYDVRSDSVTTINWHVNAGSFTRRPRTASSLFPHARRVASKAASRTTRQPIFCPHFAGALLTVHWLFPEELERPADLWRSSCVMFRKFVWCKPMHNHTYTPWINSYLSSVLLIYLSIRHTLRYCFSFPFQIVSHCKGLTQSCQ